ncbi:MAG: hypothetical protein SynsKO_09850 [Synoicihabitans sp.]
MKVRFFGWVGLYARLKQQQKIEEENTPSIESISLAGGKFLLSRFNDEIEVAVGIHVRVAESAGWDRQSFRHISRKRG